MADRKLTVLNPSGYQELLQNSDNLKVPTTAEFDGQVTLNAGDPVNDNHLSRKAYVDSQVQTVDTKIDDLTTVVNNLPAGPSSDLTLSGDLESDTVKTTKLVVGTGDPAGLLSGDVSISGALNVDSITGTDLVVGQLITSLSSDTTVISSSKIEIDGTLEDGTQEATINCGEYS